MTECVAEVATAESVRQWIETVAAAAAAVAVVSGVFIASLGLRTWRDQLRGTAEYDLARRVLFGVYTARGGFNTVRAPWILTSEYPEGRSSTEAPRADDLKHIYKGRLDLLTEILTKLDVELLEAKVLWGDRLTGPDIECKRQFGRLVSNVHRYIKFKRDESKLKVDQEIYRATEQVVQRVETEEQPDEFGAHLDDVIEEFEGLLKPFLGRPRR